MGIRPYGPAAIDRQDEPERPHEVRSDDLAERAHLVERLPYEPEVAHAQIPEPAVNELRRCAGSSRCEVVPLDQRDGEAVARCQFRDAGADDPPADDEQVESLRPQPLEAGRTRVLHPRRTLPVA